MSRFKEPVIWAMIVIVCFLAIVLLLRYKDKIDGYGKLKTKFIGTLAYGKQYGVGWAGSGTTVGTIDNGIDVGLRSDGVLTWRKAEEGKKWQDLKHLDGGE